MSASGVIAYLDSSVLARAYLVDEDGYEDAKQLLGDPEVATVTGTWTRIEVSGALVRAARSGRGDERGLLELLDADLAGPVVVLSAPPRAGRSGRAEARARPGSASNGRLASRYRGRSPSRRWPSPTSRARLRRATRPSVRSPSSSASWRSDRRRA